MSLWKVEIIEGYASDLRDSLNRFSGEGWPVRFVLPNGVNRWTVIGDQAGPPPAEGAHVETFVEIVGSQMGAGAPGLDEVHAEDLKTTLADFHANGWSVRFVLTNGVNRWTVIGERVVQS